MWEDGIYLGVKATTAEVIVGNRNGVWLTRTVRRKPAKERWDRSNLEMVVAVPWRENEDDPKMDGERLKSEVIVMDKEHKEKLEAEEHVPVPKRVYISRENLAEFGFTARCPGCMSLLRGTARQAHTENCRRRLEEAPKGTAKAHAAMRRMREYQERAAEKGTKRTKSDQEGEELRQREHGESIAGMVQDAPTSSSSGSGDVTPTQSSSSSAVKTNGREGGDGCKEAIKKRKAEEEHPEDPDRNDGKWMRTNGNKRKAGEESEESRLRKIVRYLKELDKMENKESGKTQEIVEVAVVEVNEEEEWMTE